MDRPALLHGYFVTGTDTGAGKTLVAAGLVHAAAGRGWRAAGIKPVAAGCRPATTNGGTRLVNDDALALDQAASVRLAYADINPVALEPPIAPHIAAAGSGIDLRAGELVAHCRRVGEQAAARVVVVEGAGGWLVPLNPTETMETVACGLGFPVIIVVGLRLGCLNHALMTARSVRAAGLPVAGWVANQVDPGMAEIEGNIEALRAQLPEPMLGRIPYLGTAPSVEQVAAHLHVAALGWADS